MKKLFKFRQYSGKYLDLYLFQKSRWSLGFVFDIDYNENMDYDWNTWLFSIDIIFIYIEFHNPPKNYD